MFGDIAHGLLLMLFGLWLVFNKNKEPGEITKLFLPHKYSIVLMGFFSAYCGLIYNDFLSISLNIFGSCYDIANAVEGKPIVRVNN